MSPEGRLIFTRSRIGFRTLTEIARLGNRPARIPSVIRRWTRRNHVRLLPNTSRTQSLSRRCVGHIQLVLFTLFGSEVVSVVLSEDVWVDDVFVSSRALPEPDFCRGGSTGYRNGIWCYHRVPIRWYLFGYFRVQGPPILVGKTRRLVPSLDSAVQS